MNIQIQRAEIARIAEMLAPMCDGDEELLADMMEGESNIDRILSRIWEQIARDDELLTGIKARKATLAERESRIKARKDGMKEAIGLVLRDARLHKFELPEVTLSVRDGKPGIAVVDPEAVPDDFCEFKRVPRKTEINAAFDPDGDLPNWLVRTEPKDVVTARKS